MALEWHLNDVGRKIFVLVERVREKNACVKREE